MIRRDADDPEAPQPSEAEGRPQSTVDQPASGSPSESEAAEKAAQDHDGRQGLQVVGQVIFQILVGLGILVAAGTATYFLVQLKTAPSQISDERAPPNVVVQDVQVGDVSTRIEGFGTVRATRQLQLSPQVSGRVVEVHPQLIAGGTIPAGATVLQIDPTDYELALEQAQASLARAEAGLRRIDSRRRSAMAEVARVQTALQTVQAEAEVARREFERINPGEPVPPLVAKEPQLAEARAALAAAEAALEDVDAEEEELAAQQRQAEASVRQARVDLERTQIRLPEGEALWRVSSESVDVGQSVGPTSVIATVFDARSLEVPVPLEDRQVQWITIGEDQGSRAVVSARFGGQAQSWPGQVTRTEGQIDPRTRLLDVVVDITAAATQENPSQATLLPGMFVDVVIDGSLIDDVATLPRRAVHVDVDTGSTEVYVVREGVLAIVPVEIVRRSGDSVQVRGLTSGQAVILTRLDVVVPGMPVQVGATRDAGGAMEGEQ